MNSLQGVKYYPPFEEKINVSLHAVGLVLSIFGLFFLMRHAILYGNSVHIVSFGVFGTSLVTLYAASTCYHSSRKPELRRRLRIFDHASIYILIAGTYTPFTLVTLNGALGSAIFYASWGVALTGIILKLFFTGRYRTASTLMYVFMGWMMVFAIKPLIANLPMEGLLWLFGGGLAYTTGAIIYGLKRLKFNHATFHVFVLIGSACHFVAVFVYVLPSAGVSG